MRRHYQLAWSLHLTWPVSMHCTHRWYMSTCKELTLFSYELQHYIHSRYLRRPWALVRTLIADLEVSYYGQYWAMVLILLQPARLKKGRVDICHLWHLKVARLDPVPCVNRQGLLSSLWLYNVHCTALIFCHSRYIVCLDVKPLMLWHP